MPGQPPIDQVRDACTRLAAYLDTLEILMAELGMTGFAVGTPTSRPVQPLPGDQPAWFALTSGLEGIRRLEAFLRYMTAGHPGQRRGMSAGNTLAVFDVLPKLAAGLDEDWEAAAARYLERLIRDCQSVNAIDELTRHRPLPRAPGDGLPAACPHCECFMLKAVLGPDGKLTGRVECHAYGCRDGNGSTPRATMGTNEHGEAGLLWDDGLFVVAPELAS